MMDGAEGEAARINVTDADVDTALDACGGDPRTTIKALLVAGQFLERELVDARKEASRGYVRARPSRRKGSAASASSST